MTKQVSFSFDYERRIISFQRNTEHNLFALDPSCRNVTGNYFFYPSKTIGVLLLSQSANKLGVLNCSASWILDKFEKEVLRSKWLKEMDQKLVWPSENRLICPIGISLGCFNTGEMYYDEPLEKFISLAQAIKIVEKEYNEEAKAITQSMSR